MLVQRPCSLSFSEVRAATSSRKAEITFSLRVPWFLSLPAAPVEAVPEEEVAVGSSSPSPRGFLLSSSLMEDEEAALAKAAILSECSSSTSRERR